MTSSHTELKSVRLGKTHINAETRHAQQFKSINAAKRQSRELGGAGKVRIAASSKEAERILDEAQDARNALSDEKQA